MNLKPFVNNKELWEDFLQEVESRISSAHKRLEQECDEKELYRCQGEVRALRQLKKLRDKVNNA